MSKTRTIFTATPWKFEVRSCGTREITGDGNTICFVKDDLDDENYPDDEADANAAMISATPDALEVCEMVLAGKIEEAAAAARAALTKANWL